MATYKDLTKEQLINNLIALNQRINELERIENQHQKIYEELIRTKSMYQGLFEFAPDAIMVVNRDGQLIQINAQAERLFGYGREEIIGKPVEILMPERFRQRHIEHRKGYSLKPRVRPMGTGLELYGKRKDGSEFPVDISLGPLEVEKEVSVVGVIRDITGRKQAEEALAEGEQRYRRIIETAEEGIATHESDGTITYVNQRMADMLGYSHEEIIGRSSLDFVDTEEREAVIRARESVKERGGFNKERKLRRKDGSVLWTMVNVSPQRDGAGNFVGYLAMHTDITERKQAEEKLRENQVLLNTIMESTPDPVYVKDDRSRIIMANPALSKVVGKPLEEILGRTDSEYYGNPDTGQMLREHDLRVMESGQNKAMEETIPTPDGYRTFLSIKTPYRNASGDIIGITGISHDITERKRAEEALKKAHQELEKRIQERTSELSDAVGRLRVENIHRKQLEDTLRQSESQVRFFALQCLTAQEGERKRVAGELHDSIAAALSAMRFKIDKVAEEMKQGHASAESLKDLASNVMEINNEVRRIMADLRPSVLDDLGIIAAMNWFCREYQKTYLHISVENQIEVSEHEVPDSLKTPIFRICQEAMNNIAKYSQASHVNLSLRKGNNGILLTIQDNGQGFDLNTIKRGMGLSTMRERAQFSGGSFHLESAVGKGTVVRASWPLGEKD